MLALSCGAGGGELVAEQQAKLGATYYVSTSGNDANAGTVAQPWRTLQKAVDSIAAGDTIIVAAGSYAGARVTSSGASGAPKTIRAAAGARPILNVPSPRAAHTAIFELESFDGRIGHWTIEGFEITSSPGAGIDLRDTEYVTVRNNWVHHNGRAKRATGIFMAFSDHPTIVNNESSYNSEHGIYQSNSGDYPVLEQNRLHHNTVCGIHVNGDASFGGDGQVSHGTIAGNVIYENGATGGSAINLDGMSDSLIANNLIYANRAAGISLFQQDAREPSSRNQLYGNTIVMPSGSRWAVNIPSRGAVGNRIVDNILYHEDAGRGAISIYDPAAVHSDYNVVVGRFSPDDQNTIVNLDRWRAYGRDLSSRTSTPAELFVNPSAGDYHLKAGAVAVDTGTPLSAIGRDGEGDARPQGAGVDIGWDERASDGTPVPPPTSTPVPPPPTSTPVPPPPTSTPPASGCIGSASAFTSTAIVAPQAFTLQWEVTPSSAQADAAVAVAPRVATRWTDLAAIVRFNPSGAVDARNGGGYAAAAAFNYVAGTRYRVRMVVDVAAHRYDAFVAAPGAAEVTIAKGYAFRTEQQGVTSLTQAVVTSGRAALSACNLTIGSGGQACLEVPAGAPKSSSMPAQTGSFSIVRNVTPRAARLDAGVGLALGAATRWTGLAANVRFNAAGTIDVRNAAGYAADRSLSYSANLTYRVRFAVDVARHRYSVYVTAPGGAEQTLATDYAFRTEHQSVTALDHVVGIAESGTIDICQ